MKRKNLLLGFSLLLMATMVTFSCNSKSGDAKEETQVTSDQETEIIASVDAASLINSVCYVCHNPKVGSHDEMLAPPLVGMKQQYLKASAGRDDFVERMFAFVSNPSEELAMMKGPIRRFGLMPKTALSDQELKAIVGFIYDNELPEPDWFAEHEQEMHGTEKD